MFVMASFLQKRKNIPLFVLLLESANTFSFLKCIFLNCIISEIFEICPSCTCTQNTRAHLNKICILCMSIARNHNKIVRSS